MTYYDDTDEKMSDDKTAESIPDDMELLIQRQFMETRFPTHEILYLSKDEYLVFYHSILTEIKRIQEILFNDANDDVYTLYGGSYPSTHLEKDKLEELANWIKKNSLFLDSYNHYLVPMPHDWQQRMLAFIRGSASLFRESVNQLVQNGGVTE